MIKTLPLEFWTPKQESSCLVPSTEKLKFATNLEETETFQTLLIVKNLNDEALIEKRGDIPENFNTKLDQGDGLISNDGPNGIARQNFNARFDIVSNRTLKIHELLLPNIPVSGLSGTNQPLQTNAHYHTAQSDIGLIGISSDMDDLSPAQGDVHSTSDSVGEMQWSSPDSVSIVRETKVNSTLSPNEGRLPLVTTEADGLRNNSPKPNGTEKASMAARNADVTLESEPPKPTKRTRTADDQFMRRSLDQSSVGKQHTFFAHERDTPMALSGEDIHSPITVNTSTAGPLEAIVECSMESDTSVCPPESCDFLKQSMLGVKKSEELPCSNELETIPTIPKRTSTSDPFKVADENTTASSNLGGDQKCTSLMESQCFGEHDEILTATGLTEIKLEHTKSTFTPFPGLLQSIAKTSGGGDKVKGQGEEPNSRPRNQISGELTSDYNLVTSSDDLSCQTMIKSDEESFYFTKGKPPFVGEPEEVIHNRCIEIRRSRTSNTYSEGYIAQQSPQNPTVGSEVKKDREACDLNAQENAYGECQSVSPVQKEPMPPFKDSRTGNVTTITDVGDGYFSDTYIERIKPRLTDMLDENFKAIQHDKRISSSFESTNLLSQRGMEKYLTKKQSASESHLTLAINKTRNDIPSPYSLFSTINNRQVDVGSTINGKKSLKSSIEPTIAGSLKIPSSAAVDTSESPAISNVASENDLLESFAGLRTKKTALTESGFPLVGEKRVPPYVELNLPGDSIKYFEKEGSSQVDIDVDLKTSTDPNMRQTSPSIPPKKLSQREELESTSNSMILGGDKNGGYCEDVVHARSETASRSAPQNCVPHPLNENSLKRGLWESQFLTIKTAKGKVPDASSQISLCHENIIENKLRGGQKSVQESSQRVKPTNISEQKANLSRIRRTCSATKTMKHDPNDETCSGSRKNHDDKSIKSDASHSEKLPRKVLFKDNLHEYVSDKLKEQATSHSVGIQGTADDDSKGCRDYYPAKDLAKTMLASPVHSNLPVLKAREKIQAEIPLYSPASKKQSTLAVGEPSLRQTADLVKHGSWKSDKTQNIDAPQKVISGEQSEIQTQDSGEIVQASINMMESCYESSRMSTQKGKKWKSALNQDSTEKENPKAYNEISKGQFSRNKKAITPTTNCISSEDTSYGVKWTSQDLSMSSPKCRSPFPDSDCDPEITSSTMSRPQCLLLADKFPSPTAPSKNLPRVKTAQADYLEPFALRGDLKNDKQNDVLLSHHYAASGAEKAKSEVMKRRQRLGEHRPEIGKRFSSISINDEANQQKFEFADTAVGSSYSEPGGELRLIISILCCVFVKQ